MRLGERLKVLLNNVVLKGNLLIRSWFSKNTGLKVGVFIFWTLWMLWGMGLQKNQGFPLYQVPILYIGGYFFIYFLCAIVLAFLKKYNRIEYQGRSSPWKAFDMQQVDTMTGTEFEKFCINILLKNGYRIIMQTKATGDQGVDIIAEKGTIKYAIQCKCYRNPVGNHAVMEVCSGRIYYGCNVGVVMTNSTFTPQAMEHAKRTGILLWDREIIQKMIIT